MASGYKLKDGRDFDSLFSLYDGGQTLGYKIKGGADIGSRYAKGNSGITTKYKNKKGVDIGAVCGKNVVRVDFNASSIGIDESCDSEGSSCTTLGGYIGFCTITSTNSDLRKGGAIANSTDNGFSNTILNFYTFDRYHGGSDDDILLLKSSSLMGKMYSNLNVSRTDGRNTNMRKVKTDSNYIYFEQTTRPRYGIFEGKLPQSPVQITFKFS